MREDLVRSTPPEMQVPDAMQAEAAVAAVATDRSIPRALIYSAASLLFVAAVTTGWVRWNSLKSTAVASSTSNTSQVRIRRSVAVLGFQNIAGSQGGTWLGTALSEMLSTE